jgi:hypothetical protein
LSYQTGFRIPTTQNQYIDLATPAGTLIGGLPEFDARYKLATGVTRETLTAFATDLAKNGANSKYLTDAVKAAAVQYATAAVTAQLATIQQAVIAAVQAQVTAAGNSTSTSSSSSRSTSSCQCTSGNPSRCNATNVFCSSTNFNPDKRSKYG